MQKCKNYKSKNSYSKVSKYHLKTKQCKQIPSKNESANKYHLKRLSAEKEVSRIFQYKQKVSKIPTRNSAKTPKMRSKIKIGEKVINKKKIREEKCKSIIQIL